MGLFKNEYISAKTNNNVNVEIFKICKYIELYYYRNMRMLKSGHKIYKIKNWIKIQGVSFKTCKLMLTSSTTGSTELLNIIVNLENALNCRSMWFTLGHSIMGLKNESNKIITKFTIRQYSTKTFPLKRTNSRQKSIQCFQQNRYLKNLLLTITRLYDLYLQLSLSLTMNVKIENKFIDVTNKFQSWLDTYIRSVLLLWYANAIEWHWNVMQGDERNL